MTPSKARLIGQLSKTWRWTDEQLRDQIYILELLVSYLEGRGDCGILVGVLRGELEQFKALSDARRIPHPMLCVHHGGSPVCEKINEEHNFVCPKCLDEKDDMR